MSLGEHLKKETGLDLVVVRQIRKNGDAMIVTDKTLLPTILKEKRRVYLPACKRERCDKFDEKCNACILDYYGVIG